MSIHRVEPGTARTDTPEYQTQFGTWGRSYAVEVIRLGGGARAVVPQQPVEWRDNSGVVCVVPVGFVSDGATLPRVAWWLLGGRLSLDWLSAALVHDYACVIRPAWAASSAFAVEVFYRGLRADGLSWWRARLAYHVVRVFGPQWRVRE